MLELNDDLRALLHTLTDAVCVVDEHDAVVYANPAAVALFGGAPGSATGQIADDAGQASRTPCALEDGSSGSVVIVQPSPGPAGTLLAGLQGMVYRCINDGQWTVEYVSDGCYDLVGLRPEEIAGQSLNAFSPFIHPDDQASMARGFVQAFETGEPFHLSYRFLRQDGEVKWAIERGKWVVGEDGQVEALESFVVDATEVMAVDTRFQQTAARYAGLYNAAPGGIVMLDHEGNLLDANGAAWEMLGLTAESIHRGEPWYTMPVVVREDGTPYAPEDRPGISAARAGQSVRDAIVGVPRQDGEGHRWLLVNAEPVRDPEDGSLQGSVATLTDITAQKEAQQALRESETRYRTIIEASPFPVILVRDGRHVFFNPAAVRLLGHSDPVALLNTPMEALVAPASHERARELLEASTQGRTAPPEEVEVIRADGQHIWLSSTVVPLQTPWGPASLVMGQDTTDRRDAEQALRESEGRYRTIINSSPFPILLVRGQQIAFANPAATELLGYPGPDDIAGLPVTSVVKPEYLEMIRERIRTGTMGRGNPPMEVEVLRADGEVVWVASASVPIEAPDGPALLVMGKDIRDRKRAEAALRESEANLREAHRIARLARWEYDVPGDRLIWSQETYDVFGLQPGDMTPTYEGFFGLVHPDDRAMVGQVYRECVESRSVYELEHRMLMPDGRVMWVYETAHVEYDEAGVPVRSVGVVQDITRRREAEEALRAAEDFAQTLIRSMTDGVSVLDADGVHVDVNPAFCEMTGFSREELIGVGLPHPYWPPEAGEEIARNLATVRRDGGQALELTFMRKNGERFPVIVSPAALVDEHGNVTNYVATVKDITRRKQAEEALRESEAQLREAQRIARMGWWELDLRTNHLEWSDSVYGLFEVTPGGFAGTYEAFRARVHPDDRDTVHTAFRQAVEGQMRYEVEHRVLLADGRVRWVYEIGDTEYEPTGAPIRTVGTVQDITLRKEAEEALRESEVRFQRLFESMQEAFLLLRPERDETGRVSDYTVIAANDGWGSLTNTDAQTVVGKRMSEVLPGADASWYRIGESLVETGEGRRFEKHSDLLGKWLSVNAFHSGDGNLGLILEDITPRRQAEEALRASRQLYQSLAENSRDFIFIIGADDTVKYVNRFAAEQLGMPPDEVTGLLRSRLFPPEVSREQARNIRTVLTTGEAIRRTDRTPVGEHDMWLDTQLLPLTGPEGDVIEVLGISRDITALKAGEETQRMASIGQLASGVAHEFNNLLSSMSLAAEFARDRGDEAGWQRLSALVLQATEQGGSICRNLMTFARPRTPQQEPTCLESALEAALALAGPQVTTAGVTVRRDYQAGGRRVLADQRQLEQVFLNLIINACHAMPRGGTLAVTVKHVAGNGAPGEVMATVADTGTGIAPEHLLRLFDPFFTTKGPEGDGTQKGMGLGLPVSRSIIASNGGTITASGEPGAGATFELRFPALPEHVEAAAEESPEEGSLEGPEGGGARILVAEDSGPMRELLVEGLGAKGYSITARSDASQAVELLRTRTFDLVITDLSMPGGGGREVLATARELEKPPPVMVITGKVEESTLEELMSLGACLCIRKPFKFKALLEAIADCLEERAGPDS